MALAADSAHSIAADPETLSGAGSSFVLPLMTQWAAAYAGINGVQINYNPIGSGGGIAMISARTVDFGTSDAPLSADQFTLAQGVVQIPWALSATSIPYNLPGVIGRLRLTGPVLADIYLGKITRWDDPRIRAINPGLWLPSLQITPVYRSDASGTTFNLSDYLSHVSPTWRSKLGCATAIEFPVGVGAKPSSGVVDAILKTPGSIGYVDVAYALKSQIPFAAIQNHSGAFTLPGLRNIAAAASSVKSIPKTNAVSIVDPPTNKRIAYTISTFTYIIVPLTTPKAAMLRQFISWALTAGQQFGPKLLFSPIPAPVLARAQKTLTKIKS
jgi:phosphate ABC transporter phosphate-binding protein